MKVTVIKYLNVRVGKPSLNAPCYQYLAPGSEIEVDGKLYKGDKDDGIYEGIDTWMKDEAGNYYWSGGIEKAKNILNPVVNGALPWWITDFGIDEIWKTTKGEGVTVITLDSGFKPNHIISGDKIKLDSVVENDDGIDMLGHGTLMATIIAGNNEKIIGLAPEVKITSIKISNGIKIDVNNLKAGLKKALRLTSNIDERFVINCSLELPAKIPIKDKIEIQNLINELSKNSIVISAVGNTDWENKTIPASLDKVISCAGLRKGNNNYHRLGSNYWAEIKITTPAEFPVSDLEEIFNQHIPSQGSSHACAYTAGLVSLLLSQAIKLNKRYLFSDISQLLFNSSDLVVLNKRDSRVLIKEKLVNSFKTIT